MAEASRLPNTTEPGQRNLRTTHALNGLSLYPQFKILHHNLSNNTQFVIALEETGSGDEIIRIPFRPSGISRNASGTLIVFVPNNWLIDLSTSVIDFDNSTGGIIDGIAGVAANTDYLLWAFWDKVFKGFGVTRRPYFTTGELLTASQSPGTIARIDVTGAGYTFTKYSRVIINEFSADIGENYNQGIIIDQTADTIEVQLDESYGAIEQTNTAITNLDLLIINQVDRFEPKIGNTNTTYGSVAHAWSYLGSFDTDSSSEFRTIRKRNEYYRFFRASNLCWSRTLTAIDPLVEEQVCLSRWVPLGASEARLSLDPIGHESATGDAYVRIGLDEASVGTANFITIDKEAAGGSGISPLRRRDNSFFIQAVHLTKDPDIDINIVGFMPAIW